MLKPKIFIGIDPGVKTGVAVWDTEGKKFRSILTLTILEAIELVSNYHEVSQIMVIVEDARLRKSDPGLTQEKAQGAGSVKRDCKIWEEFLTGEKIPHQLRKPNGKLNKLAENKVLWQNNTKWSGNTSEHARCASMLVWNI